MRNVAILWALVAGLALPVSAAEVWTADFDTDGNPDGVVDIYDQNLNKVMLSGPAGGRLTVVVHDENYTLSPPASYPYLPDKAGRPLGTGITLTAADSFSGLYRFRWTDLWGDPVAQAGSSAWEFVGFLGDSPLQTRQQVGALIRHWQISNGNYYLRLATLVGDSEKEAINQTTTSILLGPNAESRDFLLAVGWDAGTNTVKVELYDAVVGALLGSFSAAVTDPEVLDGLAITHMGWGDYTSSHGAVIQPTVWSVDSIRYYDTFEDAFPTLDPGKVWASTFDVNGAFDGFLNIYDGPAKSMLNTNGASGGTMRVRQIDDDALGSPYVPDKSGRPIGRPLLEPDSWSVLYRFRWTGLPTLETPVAYQFTGAFGPHTAQTRQVAGALIRHWKVGDDYYVNLGLILGGRGAGQNMASASTFLGPDAENTDYQLAVGWNTDTDQLMTALYHADGTFVGTNGMVTMDVVVPTNLVTDFELYYVGWGDYTGDLTLAQNIIWQVDSVELWYEDAMAAFNKAAGIADSDLDGDGDVDLDDYALFAPCLGGPKVSVPPGGCTQDAFNAADIDLDDDVDLGDFRVFTVEFTG